MRFSKYHALGNDYLVLNPADYPEWAEPTSAQIQAICHRNYGLGSDGILWGPSRTSRGDFALRIFNPDGSEAEKSGNGLRIFARYLWDHQLIETSQFTIDTPGGLVKIKLHERDLSVSVAMGQVSFLSTDIPMSGPPREVINEPMTSRDREFTVCAATIGNPHCVIPLPEISADLARSYGPSLETHSSFPQRANVQFMQVIDRQNIRIEIWERGAGYTLASGSSSSAAAAVARKLGLVDDELTVRMPGGAIGIALDSHYNVSMTGPVNHVADGRMYVEIFEPKRSGAQYFTEQP